jgi:anti-sigma28 factor (negative regulator of flagellin synthesis)
MKGRWGMRIHAVTQSIQAEFRKIENAKKTDKLQSAAKIMPSDKPQISESAQQLSTTKSSIDAITAQLSVQDEIRTDKIAEVQEKIKNGFYNSPEFIDKLADKLLAEFGLKTS